jgi:hypothetical protein
MSEVEKTLDERGARYGDYVEQCRISQNIKSAMADSGNWDILLPHQKDALEMMAVKVSRILNGDPMYSDNWHDCSCYFKLVEGELDV